MCIYTLTYTHTSTYIHIARPPPPCPASILYRTHSIENTFDRENLLYKCMLGAGSRVRGLRFRPRGSFSSPASFP